MVRKQMEEHAQRQIRAQFGRARGDRRGAFGGGGRGGPAGGRGGFTTASLHTLLAASAGPAAAVTGPAAGMPGPVGIPVPVGTALQAVLTAMRTLVARGYGGD